jgi:hypothetical protein
MFAAGQVDQQLLDLRQRETAVGHLVDPSRDRRVVIGASAEVVGDGIGRLVGGLVPIALVGWHRQPSDGGAERGQVLPPVVSRRCHSILRCVSVRRLARAPAPNSVFPWQKATLAAAHAHPCGRSASRSRNRHRNRHKNRNKSIDRLGKNACLVPINRYIHPGHKPAQCCHERDGDGTDGA